jgi:hypothetical protein
LRPEARCAAASLSSTSLPPRAFTCSKFDAVFSKVASLGRHDDHRHGPVDQGDWPMFDFAGGEPSA